MPDEDTKEVERSYSLIDLRDVLGIGKSADRLISMIEKGVGKLWQPLQVRLVGAAQRSEAERWLALLKDNDFSGVGFEASISDRAAARLVAEQLRKQENREAIAKAAIEEFRTLRTTEEETNAIFDEDWIHQFWTIAENSSRENMQNLWGRLLATAASRNYAFSPRTLSFLQLMDLREIAAIEKVAPFVGSYVDQSGDKKHFLAARWGAHGGPTSQSLFNLIGSHHSDILGPIGFYVEDGWAYDIAVQGPLGELSLEFGSKKIHCDASHLSNVHTQSAYNSIGSGFQVTELGYELTQLCQAPKKTNEYVSLLAQLLTELGATNVRIEDR